MDAITLVAYTFEIGSALVERCELVKQCHTESTRIAVRTLSVLASLESASNEFSGRVEFEASLTELKRALEEARDLVSRCQKARSVVAKIGALMRANTLKKELVRVEGDLERVAADLQIPMLADIRKAVRYINERESEAAAAPSGVDAEMLEQAVRDAIRKELYNTSQGRAVDETIKDNLSKLYEAEAAVAEDQQWYSSPPDAAGGRPLLCPGHGEECALRTTKKEVSANILGGPYVLLTNIGVWRNFAVFFFPSREGCVKRFDGLDLTKKMHVTHASWPRKILLYRRQRWTATAVLPSLHTLCRFRRHSTCYNRRVISFISNFFRW